MAKPVPACECNNKTSQKQPSMVALSESEINAAMQLIQLSISADSCSDHTDYHHQEEEEEDNSSNSSFLSFSVQQGKPKRLNKVDGSKGDVAASSTSSSSLASILMEAEREEEEGDDDDDRNNFGVRKNKRYRSVAELYRVTSETVLMSVVKGNKRKKEIECLRGLGSFKFLEEIDGAESRGC